MPRLGGRRNGRGRRVSDGFLCVLLCEGEGDVFVWREVDWRLVRGG